MLLIYGTDDYLVSIQMKKMLDRDGDIFVLDAMTTSLSEVKDYLFTPCFLESSKTLILKNSFMFGNSKNKNDDLTDQNIIELINSKFDNELIFLNSKVTKSKKTYKEIVKKGKVFEIKPLTIDQLKSFTTKSFEKKGVKIEERSVEYIVKNINNSVSTLVNYINIISNYSDEISYDDILNIVPELYSNVAFDLTKSLFYGNVPNALGIWAKLKKMGESDIAIIALISSSLRIMQKIKIATSDGWDKNKIVKHSLINPYSFDINNKISSNINLKDVNKIIKKLYNIDNRIKSGDISNESILTIFMMDMSEVISNV